MPTTENHGSSLEQPYYIPDIGIAKSLTVTQAQEFFSTRIRNDYKFCVEFDRQIHSYGISGIDVFSDGLKLTISPKPGSEMPPGLSSVYVFNLSPSSQPKVYCGENLCRVETSPGNSAYFCSYGKKIPIKNLTDSLTVLIHHRAEAEELMDKEFTANLEKYRTLLSNTPLSEAALKLKLQAESAMRKHDLLEAIDFYGKILEIAPWWPEGRFNRAMLLAELGQLSSASREMDLYLTLVPEAPNASEARKRMADWKYGS
jgi:tetratricopeptide (TPR) repeat protein